jgi:dTDP-4-dehydrorhamnose reductase
VSIDGEGFIDMAEASRKRLRAVVIGGSGQIGGWLLRVLAERGHQGLGTYASVAYPGLVRLAAGERKTASAWLEAQAPDVVFYPAGFTWVDGCERDPARAYTANLEEPLCLARVAADLGARFIYYSTDYVFDGVAGPYTEESPVNPLSVYGCVKRDAENALAEALGEAQLTIRTSWVFGPERQGKNFAYQVAKNLGSGLPMVCPSDQISSPSYGPDVARASVLLAEQMVTGTIHVAGPDVMDRACFARLLAAALGVDASGIESRPTSALGQAAARPLRGGLLTRRLDTCAPGLMRQLSECLEDFRQQLRDPSLLGWIKPIASRA